MTELLLQRLLYMTIVGSVIILVVLLFRLLFRKAPKSMTVFLWLLVFFRLLCPISIKAPISAFQWIPQLIGTEAATMTEEQRYPASETQQAGETGQNLMPVPGEAEQDAAPARRPGPCPRTSRPPRRGRQTPAASERGPKGLAPRLAPSSCPA